MSVSGLPAPPRPRRSRQPSLETPSPHKHTQTHPYRAPQPRVAGWEKRRRLPSGPEVVLPRNASFPRATPTSRAAGEADRCRKEAGSLLRGKRDGPAEEPVRHRRKGPGTGYRDTALLCIPRTQLDGVPDLVTVVTGVAVCLQIELRGSRAYLISSHEGILKGTSHPDFSVLEYAR